MTSRFSFTLIFLVFFFLLPWWVNLILGIIFIFYFPWYYEVIGLTLIYDLLYGFGFFEITLITLILIPLVESLKQRLYVFS